MPKIAVLADTRAAQREVKDLSEAFDKVGDSLDDVARDGDKAGDKLERSFSETVKDARKAKEAVKDIGDAADKTGDEAKRGMKKASEGLAEFKDEAGSSGREAAASFGGGFEDVADFLQESVANGLSGFGPLGAAAGIALAAVIGTALSQAAAAQEKLNEAREAASELARTMYENNGELPLTEAVDQLFDRLAKEGRGGGALQGMIDQWADFGSVLDNAEVSARRLGRPVGELIDALSGSDLDQTRAILAAVNRELDGLNDWTPVWDEQYRSLNGYKQELEATLSAQENAARINEALADSGVAAAQKRAAAEEEAADARAAAEEEAAGRITAAVDAVRDSAAGAYDSMRDKAYEKATADDAAFDVGKWLSYVEESRAQADAYRANLQAMQLSPDEWSNLLSLPEEARAGIAASYASAGDDGKARIRAALGDGGAGEAGSEAAVSFSDAFDPKADVDVKADTTAVESKLKDLTKDRDLKVRIKLDTSEIDAWIPPRKTGTVLALVDGSAWDRYRPATKTARVVAGIEQL